MFPGQIKISFKKMILLFIAVTQPVVGAYAADTSIAIKTGSVDIAEAAEIKSQINSDIAWLEEADRLMVELTSLDVRMYTLINKVGDEESRTALNKQRSINRKLIYDLIHTRNSVIERLGKNRQAMSSL